MNDNHISTHYGSRICLLENDMTVDELTQSFNQPELYLPEMEKINSEHRRREYLGLRLALKQCLNGEEKTISHTPDGKPVLTDNSYKISFSHCKNWISVIANPTYEVGIDIERPTDRIEKIHTRFLGNEELEEYLKHRELNYLKVVWSTKEALYKIIGEKAYNFARKIRILPFELREEGELKALFQETNKEYLVNYRLTDKYTLAYCTDNE